jgi:hypothetical protein
MLAATGAASILARLSTRRPSVLRTIVAGATLAAVALAAAPFLAEIPRLPAKPTRRRHRRFARSPRRRPRSSCTPRTRSISRSTSAAR